MVQSQIRKQRTLWLARLCVFRAVSCPGLGHFVLLQDSVGAPSEVRCLRLCEKGVPGVCWRYQPFL